MTELHHIVAAIVAPLQQQGEEHGIQVCAYHRGQRIIDYASGTRNASGAAITPDTLTFCWSMTKGITALCIHILAERGQLEYDDLVCRYWPEFAQQGKQFITIRQFLAHTSGMCHMPQVSVAEMCDWDGMCERFAAMPPVYHPGETPAYHAISYGWLVGEVVRRVSGRSLTQFVQDEICAPLGISDLHIGLPAARVADCADLSYDNLPHPLNLDAVGADLMRTNPDTFANRADVRQACMPGINMLSSARALVQVYASLVGTGVNGVRLLPTRRVDMVRSVQRLSVDALVGFRMAMGLGYQLPDHTDPSSMSNRRGVFGHGGWGGSTAFADPDYDFAFVLTKTRMNHNIDITPVGMAVAQAVRAHVGIPER
ncbi:MAG: serine hydrolase domain-containing protein [Roseiflexaceae bacterium]